MPAIRRTIKKTTYGIGYISFLILVISLFIMPGLTRWLQRPKATPTPPPTPIIVEDIHTVIHADTVDIVARVRNPNPRAGIADFPVTFILLDDSDKIITTINELTYLLPGSLNYITTVNVPLTSSLARVQLDTPSNPTFSLIPDNISIPNFNSFLRERTIRTIGYRQVEVQKGIVTNAGVSGFKQVDITGVAFDSQNNIVGIGQTFVGEFKVGEQREFTVQWPAPSTPTQRVIILPATNAFDPHNILDITGDPNLLR